MASCIGCINSVGKTILDGPTSLAHPCWTGDYMKYSVPAAFTQTVLAWTALLYKDGLQAATADALPGRPSAYDLLLSDLRSGPQKGQLAESC